MIRAASLSLAGILVFSSVALARQAQERPVSRLLPELVAAATVLDKGETGDHSQHFTANLAAAGVIYEINRAIMLQAAAFPFGPVSPVVISGRPGVEGTRLFGAGYIDSARSLGSGRLLFNMSYQTTTFDTIDGLDLRDSSMNLYIPHPAVTGDESDRDLLQHVVSLHLNRKVAAFSLGYGWGDRVDIGVMVPIVQMAADARVSTYVLRTASPDTPAVHEFDIIDRGNRTLPRYCSPDEDPRIDLNSIVCTGSSTARGIGDIVVRGKYTFFHTASPLAFSVDVRLPTGNSDEMIGLGALQVKPALLWSVDAGRFGLRARADYTWSNGTLTSELADGAPGVDLNVPDEIGAGLGVDVRIAPHTTVALDLLGRRIADMREFRSAQEVFPSRGPGPLPSASFVAADSLLMSDPQNLTQALAALGLRFDVPGGVIGQVSALVPVSGGGIRPQTMAVFSLTKRY